jgi:hypothetical protein
MRLYWPKAEALDGTWTLPALDGPFSMVLRLHGPEAAVLDRTWTPPPVVAMPR